MKYCHIVLSIKTNTTINMADENYEDLVEYEKRKFALMEDMRKNYKVNCDRLFDEVNKLVKNNPPLTSSKDTFAVFPIDFTDGSENDMPSVLRDIHGELLKRSLSRQEKNAKALEMAKKNGKQITLGEFTPYDKITSISHSYTNDGIYIQIIVSEAYDQSKKDVLTDIIEFIFDELHIPLDDNVTRNACEHCSLMIMIIPTHVCPTKNPMADRDLVHKAAYSYFIKNGITKRSDDDDDMVFGDDLL